jgi:hypothetical protein
MKLPEGKSRLDLVREGLGTIGLKKRGRMVVSLDRLREDPRNERRTFRNMDGLIASIKGVGLVEPLTVTPEQGSADTYRIVTGHRRFRAAKAAGLSQVEVLIREPDDELTLFSIGAVAAARASRRSGPARGAEVEPESRARLPSVPRPFVPARRGPA